MHEADPRVAPLKAPIGGQDLAQRSPQAALTAAELSNRCGAVSGFLICDREVGHGGDHRGYVEEHDDVLFWRQR